MVTTQGPAGKHGLNLLENREIMISHMQKERGRSRKSMKLMMILALHYACVD